MRQSTILLLGISLSTALAQGVADSALPADGLERRLSHGHGPERSRGDDEANDTDLLPAPAKHHRQYVERGAHRIVHQRREVSASATWATPPSTGNATSIAVASGATGMTGTSGIVPAVVAGITIASVLLLFLLFFLFKAIRRGSPSSLPSAPAGFNPAPRPFHSKAASVSSISFTDEKDGTQWKENSEMKTLPRVSHAAPQLTYSPASSDITSAAPHHTFDLRTLPPTMFPAPGASSHPRSRSPMPPASPRRAGTPQLHIPLPISRSNSSSGRRSRSSSQPPSREDSERGSAAMVHTRSTSGESYYPTGIPFADPRSHRRELAPDEVE